MDDNDTPIEQVRNLGPKSAAWLQQAGIYTRADLIRVGALGAFRAVKQLGLKPSLNLLYAMEAALLDKHWTKLSADEKANLVLTLDALDNH